MLAALLLGTALALSPLKPVANIDLSRQGDLASDVAWLDDDQLLVALAHGGVAKVTLKPAAVTTWLAEGPLPAGVPYAELVATDGDLVVVTSGGKRNFAFRDKSGKYLYGYMQGTLYPRGLAVSRGKAFIEGWESNSVATTDDLKRGALWTELPKEELVLQPLHRIVGGADAVARWRLSAFPYAGATVALPDGSIAVATSAEPGIFRYDARGVLKEVLGTGIDSVVVDAPRLLRAYANDVTGRYREMVNRQALIEDLVVTPGGGVAMLVRVARSDGIAWELWTPGRSDVERRQPLGVQTVGPFGHMKCESRRTRLACVVNMPNREQAAKPETAGANPRLLLFNLTP